MSSAADPAQVLDAAPSEEQLAVVGRLGFGPVKVVAAAGSGKTTTMAHLYAAGVASGLELGQIMAVTFTERAALELRHKVDRALEAEGAGPVVGDAEAGWIGTFHQLVRRLLNERSYLAGLPRDLDLIDEVEAAAEMSAAVASVSGHAGEAGWFSRLPAGVPPRAPLSLVQDVGRVVGRLRSTPLTPEECRRLSERTYARFLTHGDPAEEVGWHRAGLWLTLVVWEEYEGRLRRRGAVDFDGLLRQGLEALQHSPELLSWCRRKFRLVIVDEYQDTSAIQESLVKELTGPEGRNLFVVGDARQSIYGFRDANPDAMDQAQGSLLPLVSNYRSRESIVAAADHVIRHDARFGADSEMRAMRRQASRLPVLLAEVEGPEAEGEAIAAALELVHQFGLTFPDGSAQPVAWREMAVLARTLGRLGRPLEEALRRRGVPFEMAGGALLKRPEVLDLLAYLRLAADERDDLACLRVLQGPICRIPDRALLSLRAGADSRSLPLARRLRRHLDRGAPGWDAPWADRAREALATLELLAQRARLGTASEVMALALERTQLWQLQEVRMAAGQPDAERARASLAELQRLAWDMQTPRRWLTLAGLLRGLDLLSLQSGSAEPPAMAGDDRVTLSTIHRAKGLEWPLVVLADCRPFHQGRRGTMLWDRGERALICSKFQAGDTAAYSRWKASGEGRLERDEHRRLVYVAMTRARDLLLVSTSRAGEKGEFVELATAADAGRDWVSRWPGFGATQDPPWAPGRGSLEPLAQLPSPSPAMPLAWSAVEERLGQLERLWGVPVRTDPAIERLSYTAIQMLYECPRQFWFRYVAQFPEAEAPAGGVSGMGLLGTREQARQLGLLLHSTLERIHSQSPNRTPAAAAALAELERLAWPLPAAVQEEARSMLRRYLETPVAALPTVATEFEFSWQGWAGAEAPPLVGLVDRVARVEGGGLLLLDYKSNRTLEPAELAAYRRQLQLYAAAVRAGAMGPKGAEQEVRAALVLLRTGEVMPVATGPEELAAALTWARAAGARVAAADYGATRGFPDRPCLSCPYFVRCPERLEGRSRTA